MDTGWRSTRSRWRFYSRRSHSPYALIGLTAEVRFALHGSKIARDFGWSALWMLYGGGLMAAGFARRKPFLRWLALILIGITIGKVFLYDMSELERIYRIASFLALG